MFNSSPFARNPGANGQTGYGLGSRMYHGGGMMRPRPPGQFQYGSRPQTPSLGGSSPGLQPPPGMGQQQPALGQPPQTQETQPQPSQPQQQPQGLGSSVPQDPFGTQASGGQYGNLSGTPAIFGASDYGGPGPGTLNTSSAAQDILARTKAAAMSNFNQGLNVNGQPTTAGHTQLQPGQTVGDNQWNGTAWVPRTYG